jgi:hypoxanthine phosphoribosyltransferase
VRPDVEFVRLASYGSGREPEGPPRLVGPLPARDRLAGRTVLVVDTVFDTGQTLATACRLLDGSGPAALHTCVLVEKPSRRVVPITPDFAGFAAEGFLTGYGLDDAGGGRWLPDLRVIGRGGR